MQVSDVTCQNSPAKQAFSLGPLKWVLKLFSLYSDISQCSSTPSRLFVKNFLLASTIGTITAFSLYFKVILIYKEVIISIKLTDFVQTVYSYILYIVDLYYVFKYGRNVSIEYHKQYKIIDRALQITYCSRLTKKILKLFFMFITIWLISSMCDFVAWGLSYGWIVPTVYSVSYVFLLIKILTTLDLTTQIMNIDIRLQVIGDFIKEYYSSRETLPGFTSDSVDNENWLYNKSSTGRNEKENDVSGRYGEKISSLHFPMRIGCDIKNVSRCYLLLIEQAAFLNTMFGMRILLNSLSLLIDMVIYTNISIRLVLGTQKTIYDSGYFPAMSSCMRLIASASILINLVEHCEQAYRQNDRIISLIDNLLINKKIDADVKTALNEFRSLASSRPIRIHMANFFRIDYSVLASIASVVVTYTIILVQSIN